MKKTLIFIVVMSFYNCFGWTDLTVNYMIVNAFKTLPVGLRLYLEENRKEILTGAESLSERDFKSKKEVEQFICEKMENLKKMIKRREKIKKIAYEFGKMFKAVAILSYPFSFEDSYYYRDYNRYAEYKIDKFLFAFKKIKKAELNAKGCKFLVESLYKKSSMLKKSIVNDYKIYESSSNFDDLSAAFGSGSLLFSDSCFTMSALGALIWLKVNGTLNGCLIIE